MVRPKLEAGPDSQASRERQRPEERTTDPFSEVRFRPMIADPVEDTFLRSLTLPARLLGQNDASPCPRVFQEGLLGLALILVLLALAAPSRADVTVPGETGSSLRRIQAVDKAIAGGAINEAVEELQKILDEAGDDLVPLTPRQSVRARRLCHQRIAALPPDALMAYRDKVKERAKKWLEEGEAKRDPAILRKVVDEAFCSKAGDHALDRLGDLAFERGDFDAAERWWRFIALPAGEDVKGNDTLVFPDPEVDVAPVRAKQLLARLYRGDREGLRAALKAFAAAHPKAAGDLAGRRGSYVGTLQALLALPVSSGEDWPTFAGAVSRNRILGQAPGRPNWRVPRPGPTWVRRLDGRVVPRDGEPAPVGSARTLAFHPILVGDQVFTADARYVRAFNLLTGEAQVWFDLVADGEVRNLDVALKLPAPLGLSYTLSAEGDRLFVRMGGQSIEPRPAAAADAPARNRATFDSYLVCIDRRQPRRLKWLEKARNGEAISEFFEGTPVVFDGRVFAAAVRFEGGGAITAIACHDADTGTPRWKQAVDVCDVQGPEEARPRPRQHLLTRAGSRIIYASHSGAIVALEADTGRRVWAARYPTRGRLTDDARPSPRELAPPIYAAGRLFVAPHDHGRVLCLDADTGKLLWESNPPLEVVHLLGAVGDKLILTTPDGIRALSIDTGKARRDWMQPGDGSRLAPFGRGLLAAGWVYWPTTAGLRVLDQETGELVDDPAAPFNLSTNEIRGNLAAANGCLIIADTERLTAYIPPRHFLEKHREASKAEPESNAARVRLAVAEADAGQLVVALKDLSLLEKQAADDDRLGGTPIRTAARALRHDVLRTRATADEEAGKYDEATAALRRAAGTEFTFDDRAQALTQLARLWQKAEQTGPAVEAWQSLLDACAAERRRAGAGFTARMRALSRSQNAVRHIDQLIRQHGRKVYEPVERAAKALLDKADHAAERFEEVAERYPNAEAASSALRMLGARMGSGQATHACRRLLARTEDRRERASILIRLADWYRNNGFARAANESYLLAARDHREYMIGERGFDKEFVAEILKLDQPDHRAIVDRPALTLPLVRAWEIALARGERLLVPEGPVEKGFCFFHRPEGPRSVISCRDAATGKPRWQIEVSHAVTGAAIYADLLIATGADGLSALRLEDGSAAWEWAGEGAAPLSGFRLASGRLLLFEDRRRLVALNAGTGDRQWELWAPGARLRLPEPAGRFGVHYLPGDKHVLVQAPNGRGWLVDAETGRVAHELPATDFWPRAPTTLDNRKAAIVTDSNHVAMVECLAGKVLWQYATRKPSLTAKAPRVVGDAKGAAVLSDGWVLEGLNPASGEPTWTKGTPDWVARRSNDAGPVVLDGESLYLAANDVLRAFHRADGKERWDCALPTGGEAWQLTRTRDHLVIHPNGAVPPRPASLLGGYLLSLPSPPATRPFPVIFLDPADGTPVERLNFLQDNFPASVQLVGAGIVVAASGKAYGLTPRGKP